MAAIALNEPDVPEPDYEPAIELEEKAVVPSPVAMKFLAEVSPDAGPDSGRKLQILLREEEADEAWLFQQGEVAIQDRGVKLFMQNEHQQCFLL